MKPIGSAAGGGFYYEPGVGGGTGGCYEHFREKYEGDLNVNIENMVVQIQILESLKRAKYEYDYNIEVTGDNKESEWFFEIPFPESEVSDVWCRDQSGGLQFTKNIEEKNKTKLKFTFRKELNNGDKYNFTIGYTTEVLGLINEGLLSTSVTYNDWVSNTNPCKNLVIKVSLPSNSKSLNTVPPANLSHNPVIYDVNNLRPLESYIFLLHYEKRKIGKPFWLWVGGTVVSAIIGALFTSIVT